MVEKPARHSTAAFVLWSAGCAPCLIVLSAAVAGIHPTATVVQPKAIMALFFILGFAFPAIAFALASSRVSARVHAVIAICGAVLVALYIDQVSQRSVVPFAALELIAAWPLLRAMWRESDERSWTVCSIAVATLGGWSVAARLAESITLDDLVHGITPYATWPSIAMVFVVATLLGTMTLTGLRAERWSRPLYAVDALAVALFAIASWRRNLPFVTDDHHVSFFAGPVEAVRQGHWLLWDVPSQYGIANIWLIGHLPAHNGYEAFAYANMALIFCAAAITYSVMRAWVKAPWAALFCAAVVVAADFFVGGDWSNRVGSEHYPSVGAMRFIWCYVLVGLLVAGYARGSLIHHPKRVLVAGTLAWLGACWWSAEAGIFATVIWFPAALALMWLRNLRAREMVRNVALAIGALLVSVLFVELVYLVALRHGPDWIGFFEFGLLYQGGYGTAALTTFGGVWLLVSTFAVTVALVVYCWYAKKLEGLPLLIGVAAAQWATASYFVVRSADNNVDNLIPIQLLTLFAAILVISREEIPVAVGGVVRLFVVPIAVVTCGLVWSAWPFVPQAGYFTRAPGNWGAVARTIPPAAQDLLTKNGLGPGAPVLFVGSTIFQLMPPQWPDSPVLPHLWTPGLPSLLIAQLPLNRQVVYVQRFSATEPAGGYTLTDATAKPLSPDFLPALQAVYTSSVVGREGPYVLTRYQRR